MSMPLGSVYNNHSFHTKNDELVFYKYDNLGNRGTVIPE